MGDKDANAAPGRHNGCVQRNAMLKEAGPRLQLGEGRASQGIPTEDRETFLKQNSPVIAVGPQKEVVQAGTSGQIAGAISPFRRPGQ
jgi:hypothetical protein